MGEDSLNCLMGTPFYRFTFSSYWPVVRVLNFAVLPQHYVNLCPFGGRLSTFAGLFLKNLL